MIVGGGFGGMLAAVRLHEAGIGDFKIIEKVAISAALGIGTGILERRATSSPTFTYRC